MTTTNMFLNFGGKWDSPLKKEVDIGLTTSHVKVGA